MEAYRHSFLYVNPVSVVDCSVLNWVEQRELRGPASEDRLFERKADPGWVLMDLNNSFKCRMGGENLSNVQLNPKFWNLTTNYQGYERRSENPAQVGDISPCEGESGHGFYGFKSASG